jgi:3-hydroxyacyl-CoA dehydrogenase
MIYTQLKMLVAGQDKAGEFYRHFHYGLFSYISHRLQRSVMNLRVEMQ